MANREEIRQKLNNMEWLDHKDGETVYKMAPAVVDQVAKLVGSQNNAMAQIAMTGAGLAEELQKLGDTGQMSSEMQSPFEATWYFMYMEKTIYVSNLDMLGN